jgi:hypothetical protein
LDALLNFCPVGHLRFFGYFVPTTPAPAIEPYSATLPANLPAQPPDAKCLIAFTARLGLATIALAISGVILKGNFAIMLLPVNFI